MKAYESTSKHMKALKGIYKRIRAYECIGSHMKGMEAYENV